MWPFLFSFSFKKKKLTLIVPDAKPPVYVEGSFLIGRGGVGEATEDDDEKKDQVIFHRTFRLVAGLIKVTSTALKDSYFGFSRHS
jgi:hypothetical protein